MGVRAVEVEAIDEKARAFYAKYRFVQWKDDANHLVLPMPVIRTLGASDLKVLERTSSLRHEEQHP